MIDQIADDAFHAEMASRWNETFPDPAHGEAFCDVWYLYVGGHRPTTSTGRHYHDLRHIRDCLDQMKLCVNQLDDRRAVAAAIWFHDVVYDPTQPDNEARSADLAERYLRKAKDPEAFIAKVHDLILDTRHTAPPTTQDGTYMVDIDLSILGRDPETFDTYDRAIRREYAHVPEEAYRTGRAKVLRSFLAREHIFHTEEFRARFESTARANLARAIAQLTSPSNF